jgi:hypothetical protein
VSTANTTLVQGTDNQVFCYDEQDRLTWAGSAWTPPCTGTAITAGTLTASQYKDWRTYDNMGRLTAGPPTFADFQQDSYVYGDPAHIHAATSIRGQKSGIYQYAYSAAYDNAGNMTCRDQSGANCAGANAGAQLTTIPKVHWSPGRMPQRIRRPRQAFCMTGREIGSSSR